MKVSAEFQNGICRLTLTPADEWEQKLLGAVAKGSNALSAVVTYKPEGHYSYGKCEVVQVQLEAATSVTQTG